METITGMHLEIRSKAVKFFNAIDKIDRQLYGKRLNYLINGALCILIIAPFVDWWLEIPHDRLTYYTTFGYLIFVIILVLGWASTFGDEEGKWTKKKIWSRIKTHYQILRDTAESTRTNSRDEILYKLSFAAVTLGLVLKAFHNLSVFVRKPIEHVLHHRMVRFRKFEHFSQNYYWITILAGIVTLIWLYKNNPNIFTRLKNEFSQLFGKKNIYNKYHNEIAKIDTNNHVDLVINIKEQNHMEVIVTQSNSTLFNDFASALQNWHPKNYSYEYEFQNDLLRYLSKKLPGTQIETERPIGDPSINNKGRADIVINDTILIEMKRDTSPGAIQRAKGQIMQYSQIWKDKGPVILLLCNYEYDHAKLSFTPTMQDLLKLERTALTFVARKN